jgi:cytochrome o ubiquinol oxidase subunit 3
MYIRTFKPAGADDGRPWIAKSIIHLLVFAVATVASMYSFLEFVHLCLTHGFGGEAIGDFAHEHLVPASVAIVALFGLAFLGRSSGPVDFGEANAIDVEGAGLYWHFVDIVWIVIFTAVYLLEYL